MAKITYEDIQELAAARSDVYVSVFMPTHRHGQEVNNGNDKITFKTELLTIKKQLTERGYHPDYVTELLKPAVTLMEEQFTWRYMEEGLAVFIGDNYFRYFVLPYQFAQQTFIAKEFVVTPLLPVFNSNEKFYILNLNQEKVSLYLAGQYEMEEIPLEEKGIPVNIQEYIDSFEYETYNHGLGRSGIGAHGSPDYLDRSYRYTQEILKKIGNGLKNELSNGLPLVLAGSENVTGTFRSVNSYPAIMDETIKGNYQNPDGNFREKGWKIVKPVFESNFRKQIDKYHAWGGSGKASYNLEEVFDSALNGRVETVFLKNNVHKWGTIKGNGKFAIHRNQKDTDLDLYNQIAVQTILNKGNAIILEADQLPEKSPDIDLAAVFRY
jgi:hypothetical protein